MKMFLQKRNASTAPFFKKTIYRRKSKRIISIILILIGWTRHTETKAMVIIMTNSTGGIKSMYVGKEDRHCYYVNVFNGYQRVLINEDGYGDFYCEDKNFVVCVKE